MLINSFVLTGRLCKHAEKSISKSGIEMSKITLAVNNYYGGKTHTDFVYAVAFDKKANLLNNYGDKGRMLIVDLRHRERKYTGSDKKVHWASDFIINDIRFLTSVDKKDQQLDLFTEDDFKSTETKDESVQDPFKDDPTQDAFSGLTDAEKEALSLL